MARWPHKRFFGVEIQLGAKAAAHFRRDDPNLVLRHADHAGQQRADQVGNLRGRPER